MDIESREEAIIRLKKHYREMVLRIACISILLGLLIGSITTAILISNMPLREFETRCVINNKELTETNLRLNKEVDVFYRLFKDRDIALLQTYIEK